MRTDRRAFLQALAGTGVATLNTRAVASVLQQLSIVSPATTPQELAADESFWLNIQQAYDVDRSIINLNNGGVSPAPRVVIDALKQNIDYSNTAPSYVMWRHQEPNVEHIRSGIARMFGVSADEIAITRNASESLENVQFGLSLKTGDEVITTSQDYPRMITTWEQRVRRDGIVLKKVDYPTPLINHDDYVNAIEKAITPRTRVIHISHVCFMTGQILPVQRITKLARSKNIECIVDGAHAFSQFPFTQQDLDCDYYGCSLHKWLTGPLGTGFLYVRKEKIKSVWPLMAAPPELDENIRKFEEIGTHPAALHNALGAAIMFNESLGLERKAARLRWLHHRWADRLKKYDNVRFMSNLSNEENWCGILVVNIEGTDLNKVQSYLFDKHRIFTVGITHAQFKGLRITPTMYTRATEVDMFADEMERIAQGKVPEVKG
ncbi:MAG: aminotransferase class V-fold PLP-dependent enzyme [Candidatus Kapabacteria bacterium]|nr:aminotransferase class V-fold PLP-dependent enzyme [Candidatus Kapabacteria bacterium]